MNTDQCLERLKKYLQGADTRPRFINVQNPQDLQDIIAYLSSLSAEIRLPEDYSALDGDPRLDDLYNYLNNAQGIQVLRGFTAQLGLQGANVITGFLKKLASMSSSKAKIIVLCYQCSEELNFADARLRNIIYNIEGEEAERGKVWLLSENFPLPTAAKVETGISRAGLLLERGIKEVRIYTSKGVASYPHSIWNMDERRDLYDAVGAADPATGMLERTMGTEAQWIYALKKFGGNGSWSKLISKKFGMTTGLELAAHVWADCDENAQWLYYIGLRLFGAGSNRYLDLAAKGAKNVSELERMIYRALLDVPHDSAEFAELYAQRKALIRAMHLTGGVELYDYVKLTGMHKENAIYYLTDATQVERQQILTLIAVNRYEQDELISILKAIYPDLADYLGVCPFKEGEWLEEYFKEYRYSKITNHITDRLMELAEKESTDRDYNRMPPRTSVLAGINRKDTFLYWIDAMGLEFMGFIRAKCKKYGLTLQTSVCCANLPSLTSFNKDFWETFEDAHKSKVSELDEIKHHGKEDFDYGKSKLPFYLCRELELIDEVLKKARNKLLGQECRKVLIMSDHGATRMAVIHENPINLDVNARGTHGGRVCEYTSAVAEVPFAVKEDDWYILASYDHFKGAQWPHVEVHGGATLEEVLVPFIQLSILPAGMEIRLMTPVVEYSYKQNPEVEIFSKTTLHSVRALIDGKWYDPMPSTDNHTFRFAMPDMKKRGDHMMAIYDDGIEVASELKFSTKSKVGGMNTGRGGIL